LRLLLLLRRLLLLLRRRRLRLWLLRLLRVPVAAGTHLHRCHVRSCSCSRHRTRIGSN
jgi:hypothetical protein